MMKIQFFKKKWLTDFRQMSHMKLEPDGYITEKPPDETNTTQPVNGVGKQKEEEEEEIDFDDEMTESAANSEDSQPKNTNEVRSDEKQQRIEPEPETERERIITTAPTTVATRSARKERWELATTSMDNKDGESSGAIASRIRLRRSTMAIDAPRIEKMTKKRRMSVVDQPPVTDDNEITSNKSKKRRISNTSSSSKRTAVSEKPSNTESKTIKTAAIEENFKQSASTKEKSLPSSPVVLPHKNRELKKPKSLSTPQITQFFAQITPFKCNKCLVILKSHNELNFHSKIHKNGRCKQCKQTVDTGNADDIAKHMISCLYTRNELPIDFLIHMLQMKVDLKRLTPGKIDEIQKGLTAGTKNDDASRKTVIESRQCGKSSKESSKRKETDHSHQQHESENAGKPKENAVEKPADEKQTTHKDSNEGDKTKKSKSKKTPSKPKSAHSDVHEEFTISGNHSIALNWSEEVTKDKAFALRNFESDKPIYISINPTTNRNKTMEEREAQIIKSINIRKQNALNQSHAFARKPNDANLSISASTPITVPNDNGSKIASPNVPPIIQHIAKTPVPVTMSIEVTTEAAVTVDTSVPLNMSNPVNLSNQVNPPVAVHPPVAVNAPDPMNTTNEMKSPSQTGTPTTPQLLSFPNRVPLRNRAASMHLSASEYSAAGRLHILARRQSVCDNNFPKSNSPSATMRGATLDHPYANSTSPNGHVLRKILPKGSPYLQPPPTFMTKIHSKELMHCHPPPPPPPQSQSKPQQPQQQQPQQPQQQQPQQQQTQYQQIIVPRSSQLKVLTPDDLNSRAMNVAQPTEINSNPRIDSPSSTENHTNNNNQSIAVKRPRCKTTPMRPNPQISDETNITISVSLSRLGNDHAELTLTVPNMGKISYDTLTIKRKQEVQCSLLKDNVWLQMLEHLKRIRPTTETLELFRKILPKSQNEKFFGELKKAYENR